MKEATRSTSARGPLGWGRMDPSSVRWNQTVKPSHPATGAPIHREYHAPAAWCPKAAGVTHHGLH